MKSEVLIRELKEGIRELALLVIRLEEELRKKEKRKKESAVDRLERMDDESLLFSWFLLATNRFEQLELRKACEVFLEERGYREVIKNNGR